ncbi:MAG TPA: glycine cleavage system protein GcvH [Vicinamibacteria bacterium]|nr:glycine cleavage system protein GcvH [Vicinamibacteria bacterium]
MYPDDRRYSKEHEWIKMEGDRGTVGITDFAQRQLGDVVYVELPELGAKFKAGEVFGTIESVKAVSDLFCPVGGEVVEVNQDVVSSPEQVNKDPHGKSWLMVIRVDGATELGKLLTASQYQEFIEKEGSD